MEGWFETGLRLSSANAEKERSTPMSTRGIYVLREAGIEHEVFAYRYRRMGARIAADAVDQPPEIVLKSLVFQADDGSYLFALIGGDATVSTRKLGRVSGHKHVEAAAPRDAERVTGYQVGGISPLGARTTLPVLIDERTSAHPHLILNAGGRGTLVRIATHDLIAVTDAVVADLRAD
jgi:Cys-tRNA(Pro)/Cys-tRNA(Cys) deacylase